MFRVAHKRTSTRGIAGIVVEFFVLGRSHDARIHRFAGYIVLGIAPLACFYSNIGW